MNYRFQVGDLVEMQENWQLRRQESGCVGLVTARAMAYGAVTSALTDTYNILIGGTIRSAWGYEIRKVSK